MRGKANFFGVNYSIALDQKGKDTVSLYERGNFRSRYKALQHKVTGDAARTVKDRIVAGLPRHSDYKDLRDAFKVSRVKTRPGSTEAAHLIHADPGREDLRRTKKSNVLVYVKSKRRGRNRRALAVLEQYGPWPLDMLPFEPLDSQAQVVHRSVSSREVAAIRRNLQQNQAWRTELAATQSRGSISRAPKIEDRATTKSIPDLAFQFQRLEFGLGGEPNLALMRKNISQYVKKDLPKKFRPGDRSQYLSTFTDPYFTKWTSWKNETRMTVTEDRVKDFFAFQKKLGLNITGGSE